MNDLNFLLTQQGLVKLGFRNKLVKDANFGQLVKSLPDLGKTFLKFKPQNALRGFKQMFQSGPINAGMTARETRNALKSQKAYELAKAETVKNWENLNPWVRRGIKYPSQIAAGYGLGMPFGLPGWLAFGVGNEKDKLTAGQQGAAMALEGVQRQLQQSRDAYAQSGILGRLAGGFTAAFSPDKIFNPIDSELSRHIEKLRGIKPKKTPEGGAPVSNLND